MKSLFTVLGICLILTLSYHGVSASETSELVTVKLVNYIGNKTTMTIKLKGEFHTLDPSISLKEGVTYKLSLNEESLLLERGREKYNINESLTLIPEQYDTNHVIFIDDRPYLGAMDFQVEDEAFIRPVNQIPLEDYLKGVVPFEVFPSWDLEALKAQTLAARTYAVTNMKKEMDDTIRYQVYGGFTWNKKTTQAVEETKGEVLIFNDRLIDAFYSASNGGMTESNAHVWGGKALSYFPIKKDPYDPIHPWEFILKRDQISLEEIQWGDTNWWEKIEEKDSEITSAIKKWLTNKGFSDDIKILTIPRFTITPKQLESDRACEGEITVEFLQRLIDGTVLYEVVVLENGKLDRIRPMIGGTIFKSYLVDQFYQNDEYYLVKGRGYGHGVGMSQWGAQMMAEQGKTYEEILQFYFPGTKIKKDE